ncbi:MAG TPA: hypothetical protein VKQ32_00695 [Polyangia bacterium]|nr:hypothetical protein [Polyangia bacterium]
MDDERTPPNLTLRVGLAAIAGIVAQILLLAIPAHGRPDHIMGAFVLLPPSVGPTLCVARALRRARVLFPGAHGVPIALAIGGCHLAAILLCLFVSTGASFVDGGGGLLLMSIVGTVPIAVAVWRLARWWDWGNAFWMLGAGTAVGAVAALVSGQPMLMLVTTVLWTAAIGFVAGRWLAQAMIPEG